MKFELIEECSRSFRGIQLFYDLFLNILIKGIKLDSTVSSQMCTDIYPDLTVRIKCGFMYLITVSHFLQRLCPLLEQ